ncbi:MAG: DUF1206 domain-containing protein [Acidimicrobiales bacterium]
MHRTSSAEATAHRWANNKWAERLARLGFAARGLVYVVVGLIALHIAREGGRTREEASKDGAIEEIASRSFGTALLWVLAAGLVGYILWRFSEALWGKRDEDDDKKRAAKRLGSAAKALLYTGFLLSTLQFLLDGSSSQGGGGGGGSSDQESSATARVLELPAGQLIVGAIGAAIVAGGAYLLYRGFAQKFEKHLDESQMSPTVERVVGWVGTIGMAARGLVFALAGLLVIKAAVDFDPDEARGLDGTLHLIAQQTYGQVLLSVAAFGVVCFGLYSMAEARYREL